MRQKFSEVTALSEREPGRFDANADPGWTIAGKPNGGYLLAMIGQAASRVSAHPHILAASGHYLRPPDPGPVTVRADVLRAGRSASQVRASLAAGGRTCVEALLTLGRHEQEESPYWQGLPPVSLPPFEDCVPLAGLPGRFRPAILDQVDIRLDRETAGYATGTPSGRGELRGWLSLPDGEPFDGPALLYAADAFPPATLDIAMSRWVPTFELTVYVRAIPAPGPVRIVHRAQLIQGQLVDETCHIWDSKDRLVAQSTQLAGIRLGLWGAGEGADAIRLAKLGYQVDAVEVSAVACEKIERFAKSEGVKITIRNGPVETAQRLLATARRRWPDKQVAVTSEETGFDPYLASAIPAERILSGLAGEALRLESYAAIGLIDPSDPVPDEVLDAARVLQAAGFNSRALP